MNRVSDSEASDIINKIGALKNMALRNISTDDSGARFLYGARFNREKDTSNMPVLAEKSMQNDFNQDPNEEAEEINTISSNSEITKMTVDMKLKKRRFAMSLATLSSRPEKRTSLIREGAMRLLIDLSTFSDTIIQRSCAMTFANLSVESR